MTAESAALVRAIRGPVMLITVGILFALDHYTPLSFQESWPTILIVLGLLGLGGRRPRVAGARENPPEVAQ